MSSGQRTDSVPPGESTSTVTAMRSKHVPPEPAVADTIDRCLQWLGLAQNPFSMAPDVVNFYSPERVETILVEVLQLIDTRMGFALLYGDVGLGKTTICRRILYELDKRGVETSLVFNTSLQDVELLREINRDFGVSAPDLTLYGQMSALNAFLLEQRSKGKNCVIIIDDAQGLTVESLELVRQISNMETGVDKIVQIILIGQPELEEKLNLYGLRQLKSRIVLKRAFRPYSLQETATYIRTKIARGGERVRLEISDDAIKRVHEASEGNPRRINVIMGRCLYAAVASNTHLIDRGVAETAIRDVEESLDEVNGRRFLPRKALGITAGVLAALPLAAFVMNHYGWVPPGSWSIWPQWAGSAWNEKTVTAAPTPDTASVAGAEQETPPAVASGRANRDMPAVPEPVPAAPAPPATEQASTEPAPVPESSEPASAATEQVPVDAEPSPAAAERVSGASDPAPGATGQASAEPEPSPATTETVTAATEPASTVSDPPPADQVSAGPESLTAPSGTTSAASGPARTGTEQASARFEPATDTEETVSAATVPGPEPGPDTVTVAAAEEGEIANREASAAPPAGTDAAAGQPAGASAAGTVLAPMGIVDASGAPAPEPASAAPRVAKAAVTGAQDRISRPPEPPTAARSAAAGRPVPVEQPGDGAEAAEAAAATDDEEPVADDLTRKLSAWEAVTAPEVPAAVAAVATPEVVESSEVDEAIWGFLDAYGLTGLAKPFETAVRERRFGFIAEEILESRGLHLVVLPGIVADVKDHFTTLQIPDPGNDSTSFLLFWKPEEWPQENFEQFYGKEAVKRLQRALSRFGAYHYFIDGLVGPRTIAALELFQRAVGLPQTGTPDVETLFMLEFLNPQRRSIPSQAGVKSTIDRGWTRMEMDISE